MGKAAIAIKFKRSVKDLNKAYCDEWRHFIFTAGGMDSFTGLMKMLKCWKK
jgi:hypothetical protein